MPSIMVTSSAASGRNLCPGSQEGAARQIGREAADVAAQERSGPLAPQTSSPASRQAPDRPLLRRRDVAERDLALDPGQRAAQHLGRALVVQGAPACAATRRRRRRSRARAGRAASGPSPAASRCSSRAPAAAREAVDGLDERDVVRAARHASPRARARRAATPLAYEARVQIQAEARVGADRPRVGRGQDDPAASRRARSRARGAAAPSRRRRTAAPGRTTSSERPQMPSRLTASAQPGEPVLVLGHPRASGVVRDERACSAARRASRSGGGGSGSSFRRRERSSNVTHGQLERGVDVVLGHRADHRHAA